VAHASRAERRQCIAVEERMRDRDVDAGRAAGCRATILIDYGYDEAIPNEPTVRVASLLEASRWILDVMTL